MTTVLLVLIYIAFISLGLPDSMLGAAWPTIQADMTLPMAGAGMISIIISIGTTTSSLLSGRLIKKLGTGRITLISVFVTAVALLGCSISKDYLWLCMVALPLGLGAGAVDTALNNFVALHFSARHMSWLHCFWGVGATAGPLIMSFAIVTGGSWRKGYQIVGVIQLVLVFLLLFSLPLWKKFHDKQEEKIQEEASEHVWKLPGVFSALLGFFSYTALEISAGLWGATYLVAEKGIDRAVAAGYISIYYLGITLGRFVNGFFTAKFSNQSLIRLGQILVGFGIALIYLSSSTYFVLAGFILLGMGCAPIYPSMLHETPVRFGKHNSSKIMGLQIAVACIGAMIIPAALGLLMEKRGTGLYPLVLLLFLLFLILSSEKTNQMVRRRAEDEKQN